MINAPIFVVTTDYDFQGLWLNPPFSRIFVAREETKAYMEAIGVPADRLTTSGIPVRPLFGESVDADAVRKRYDLDAGKPLLLVSAGAAGGSYTTAVVKQTLRMTSDFQAVVICGNNAELKTEVERLVAGRENQYRVLGYSSDMPDLIRIASLFVGKPGGLSSSECMAAGLPMVLIKPDPRAGGAQQRLPAGAGRGGQVQLRGNDRLQDRRDPRRAGSAGADVGQRPPGRSSRRRRDGGRGRGHR